MEDEVLKCHACGRDAITWRRWLNGVGESVHVGVCDECPPEGFIERAGGQNIPTLNRSDWVGEVGKAPWLRKKVA